MAWKVFFFLTHAGCLDKYFLNCLIWYSSRHLRLRSYEGLENPVLAHYIGRGIFGGKGFIPIADKGNEI